MAATKASASSRRNGGRRDTAVRGVGKRDGDLPRELIDAAAQEFAESGYDASLAGVAKRFGIHKASLYHYIETKDDLLFAIIEYSHEQARARNVRWRHEPDPLTAIGLFAEDHVQIAVENITYTVVYTREYRRLSPERLRLIAARRSAYERNLRRLIAAGRKTGEVSPDVDPKIAALAIFGLMNWVYAWYGTDKRFSLDEVVETLRRQVIAMLVVPARAGRQA